MLVGNKMTPEESAAAAQAAYDVLLPLPEINHQTAEQPMRDLAENLGLKAGQLFGILRVAVTGRNVSPPLFETMEVVGKDTVLKRIQQAIKILETLED
jgi:glutamyl-tRNA synthetase